MNKWINNNDIEETTNSIVENTNNYSILTYGIWLGVKNQNEDCLYYNNLFEKNIDINKQPKLNVNKIKNKINIFTCLIISNVFNFTKQINKKIDFKSLYNIIIYQKYFNI